MPAENVLPSVFSLGVNPAASATAAAVTFGGKPAPLGASAAGVAWAAGGGSTEDWPLPLPFEGSCLGAATTAPCAATAFGVATAFAPARCRFGLCSPPAPAAPAPSMPTA
eukprot:CAMPEP_0204006362 /NCGR_PEP_ID=MMETSP0360-20130528/19733_1 /ASSEMBLY_ACC=CAM_ASM_000342 /TAXON_ID=268821 /ORGANISM="Scrippsiella Hangoei, Strain SHTV-5" /LENGTH=109 /DNA_ID=CAMNT_0050948453 /DNA_START=35 /DNA_END=360 /DNA_ORIENTATION=+